MKKEMNIALCLNSKEDSKTLGVQLLGLDSEAKVYVCRSLEELSECCSRYEINCFVFDYHCQNFNSIEAAQKLGATAKYKKASFLFVTNKDRLNEVYEDRSFKMDLIISRPFIENEYAEQLKTIWKKQIGKVIPENLSVLIMDDNPRVVEVLEMHMELLHHKNFESCHSVEEAKEKLSKKDFDLLLLDWDLVDGTCMEIIDMARASTSSTRLKEALTIVITGRDAVEDIMTLVENNIKDHIIKPFDHNEFEDKISYALERHQKRLG